ncbi:DUF4336 domain-containing protein [Mesorhizobium sp.]|uniref:DUF4336 domain-containing protein n=1 Tax=Mesorhizobium sp. TaxID=1871066 RepID=UPI002582B229|nr:DUF4336 domain-containing protein [Mesorhizobium sp.]
MTVVRLSNGDLFLHSPIKFDKRLANELQALGTPRHLVSPNQFHYAHIGEWAKTFPEAITWASPRVRQRARARRTAIEFARDLGPTPPEEWGREIDQTLFPGGYFKEYIFFHRDSKALILTDTIINLELDNCRALANGHKTDRYVSSSRSDLLRYAPAAPSSAAEGEGSAAKNPLMAARPYFAQPWPMFRHPRRRSHQEDFWRAP